MLGKSVDGVQLSSAVTSGIFLWPYSGSGRTSRSTHWRAAVAAWTASREEIRAHVEPAVWPRTIGNHLLEAWLRRLPLARLPLTPWHHQARLFWCRESVDWRVEWCSVVFSDESRFCLYASDGHTRVRRRPLWALYSGVHSPTTHRPHLRLHGVRAIRLQDLLFM